MSLLVTKTNAELAVEIGVVTSPLPAHSTTVGDVELQERPASPPAEAAAPPPAFAPTPTPGPGPVSSSSSDADMIPKGDSSTAGVITNGQEADPTKAETIFSIKVNYRITKWHSFWLGGLWLMVFAGVCVPKWVQGNYWYIDVAGTAYLDPDLNQFSGLLPPLPFVDAAFTDSVGAVGALMCTVVAILTLMMVGYIYIMRNIDRAGFMTKKKAFFIVGVSLTIAYTLLVLFSVLWLAEYKTACAQVGLTGSNCTSTTGAIVAVIGSVLGLLAAFSVILVNKYIPHALSMFLNVALLSCLFAWFATQDGGLGIALAILYPVYWIESLVSSTMKYLRNILSVESAETFVGRLRQVPPSIWMSIVCYHYETRTRTVSNGNGGTRTETYQVRVNTYSETIYFKYTSWRDLSGPIIGLERYSVIKLKMFKGFTFADVASANAFNGEARDFRDRNRYRDTHMDYSDGMNIEGFKDKLLAFTDISKKPKLVHACWFFLISTCGFSYPYRMWLDWMSVKKGFNFVKEVTKHT